MFPFLSKRGMASLQRRQAAQVKKALKAATRTTQAALRQTDKTAKGIVRDLERLKKLIQAESIDGDAVKTLVAKLGKETVTLADKAESRNAEKAKQLGEALPSAAG